MVRLKFREVGMAENSTVGHSRWGQITVKDLGERVLQSQRDSRSAVTIQQTHYVWRPDPCLELRNDQFRIEFDCWTDSDGTRRFVPIAPIHEFVRLASVIGFQILVQLQELNEQQRFSYHAMRLLYQRAQTLRESFGRTFKRQEDLLITAQVREDQRDNDVLPAGLGTMHGAGDKWSVAELISHGRAAANDAGDGLPNKQTCIRLGLLEAARLNPFDVRSLPPAEARGLIRMALFDLGPVVESVNEETKARVINRLCAAIEKHIDDDTDAFRAWFFEHSDNIIHQIAKSRKDGGLIDRADVRQVILEAVFDSHFYIADCMQFAIAAFLDALPEALSPDERQLFEAIYYRRQELGGLPLVMLQSRFSDIHEAAVEVLGDPTDPNRIGVLLRILEYYADMASKRRRADREYKNRSKHQNAAGRTSMHLETQDTDRGTPNATSGFDDIAVEHRRRRKSACRCATTDAWEAKVDERSSSGVVVINDGCCICGHSESVEVSLNELRDIAREIG